VSHRVKPLAHIALLLVLARLLVALIGARVPAAWSQSPILPGGASPLPTSAIVIPLLGSSPMPTSPAGLPDLLPGDSPLPSVGPTPGRSPISSRSAPGGGVWSSPLPWIGVGLLVFGLATWAALSMGRRADAKKGG
jgi:hypothetical protein